MKCVLFIISSILLFNVSTIKSSEILNLFEDLRIDRNLGPIEEEERQATLRENILNSIEVIAPHDNLDEAINEFVQQKLNSQKFNIVNAMDTILHGNSQDDVFFLFDQKGKMQYVIKAFHNIDKSKTSFFAEISGNTLVNQMGIDSLAAPTLFAISKYANNGMQDGFLLAEAAKGTRIDQLVFAIGASDNDEEGRKIAFQKVLGTFTKVGEAFAKLHCTEESRVEPLSDKWIIKIDEDLQLLETPRLSNKLKDKIDIEKLKTFMLQTIRDAKSITFAPSYQFGSAHLKNIFYDEVSHKVTLIDTGKLHYSVDHEGQPLSDPAFDLIRIKEYLMRISLKILTKEEIELLVDALFTGYQKVKPLPDENLLRFYTISLLFHKSIKFSNYDVQTDPEEMINQNQIFQEYLDLLNEMM